MATLVRGFLGVNALLDAAMALIPSFGVNSLKDGLDVSTESLEVTAASFLAHGLIRGFAAMAFGSATARRAAQISYAGEIAFAVLMWKKIKMPGAAPLLVIPGAMILGLEWINRSDKVKKD